MNRTKIETCEFTWNVMHLGAAKEVGLEGHDADQC